MTTVLAAAHQSFWSSTLLLVVAACAVSVGAGVLLVLLRRRGRGGLRSRVVPFLAQPDVDADATASEPLSEALSRAQRSLEGARWWDDFERNVEIARIKRPAIEVVYLTIGCSAAAAVLLALAASNPIAAVPALLLGPLVARFVVNLRLRRVRIRFAEQLPAHLQELAAMLRAGHSMVSGITAVGDGASEPTRGEFQRVIADERLGLPLSEALASVVMRMRAPDMEQVSLVAELHNQTGGNMAEVLDRVAEAVRERAELNRELRTLTAQARFSRWIVTALPPALVVLIELINPEYLSPLIETGTGQVLFGFAIVMVVGGSLLMGRIARIEV
ncbi:MAG TPA: type II secretion system F family protein [Solirubrobacteraceae bacterium]|jgi:tight adherence protein B|nr:type II secretion system F family protein [Solirubrobacteraceae bacterium]